jgi:hypothetical protein
MDELVPLYKVVVGFSLLTLLCAAVWIVKRPNDRSAHAVMGVNVGGFLFNALGCLSALGGGVG